MLKRIWGIGFLLMLLSVPIWIINAGGYEELQQVLKTKVGWTQALEETLVRQMPLQGRLRHLQVELSYWGGSKEQNGVFIGSNSLMRNVQPQDANIIQENTQAILSLAGELERPSYVMLIPTACAVQQSKVPYNNVAPLYNQRALIDSVYQSMAGNVTAIDVYPTLFNHQDEYIYYRTDSAPTGMGGYYIYASAISKLGFSAVRGIEQFAVEHLDYDYMGDLYQLAPYYAVQSDRISAYEYSTFWHNYTMTHYDENGARKYFSLYPSFKKELGGGTNVVMGGLSPVIDIEVSNAPNNRRLLVLGDRAAQSYLPFFLSHYSRVTFVDTANVSAQVLKNINIEQYSQVVFAYMVDQFINTPQLETINRAWGADANFG